MEKIYHLFAYEANENESGFAGYRDSHDTLESAKLAFAEYVKTRGMWGNTIGEILHSTDDGRLELICQTTETVESHSDIEWEQMLTVSSR